MESLLLSKRGLPLCEVALGPRPIHVGSAAECDLVVDDPEVAPRELVVQVEDGTVWAHELPAARTTLGPRVLAPGMPRRVGAEHTITRLRRAALSGDAASEHTEPLKRPSRRGAALRLVVAGGRGGRSVALDEEPVDVGSSPTNRVVLYDRAVSRHHCRLEPAPGGAVVRDLGSRNGTWVRGLRVERAALGVGDVVRVGRTDLRLVGGADAASGEGPPLVAASVRMLEVLAQVETVARLPWPVLVLGESGVGKELVAAAIHRCGPRAKGPFVAINAGSLPAQLVESELFGHEKGAFTGAGSLRRGVFEQAQGGTLFLDEIGELPLDLQARLLRVLEKWEVRRVGGESTVRVDVRVVAATHRDLRAMVAAGTFREDLYYRIRRLVLSVPPLRQRPEDVKALAEHFLREMRSAVGPRSLSGDALGRLCAYRFPGNARELRNVLEVAAVSCPEAVIGGAEVDAAIAEVAGPGPRSGPPENLREVVAQYGGNVTAAARALGMARSTLRDRLGRSDPEEPPRGEPPGGRLSG